MFLLFNKPLDPTVVVVLVIFGTFILSLLVVGIIKFIQVVRKQLKRNKRSKNKSMPSDEAIEIFGGLDNIVHTERQLNRILVKVVDKKLVNFDMLKAMNIGTQITGNIIKCSSEKLAIALEKVK